MFSPENILSACFKPSEKTWALTRSYFIDQTQKFTTLQSVEHSLLDACAATRALAKSFISWILKVAFKALGQYSKPPNMVSGRIQKPSRTSPTKIFFPNYFWYTSTNRQWLTKNKIGSSMLFRTSHTKLAKLVLDDNFNGKSNFQDAITHISNCFEIIFLGGFIIFLDVLSVYQNSVDRNIIQKFPVFFNLLPHLRTVPGEVQVFKRHKLPVVGDVVAQVGHVYAHLFIFPTECIRSEYLWSGFFLK